MLEPRALSAVPARVFMGQATQAMILSRSFFAFPSRWQLHTLLLILHEVLLLSQTVLFLL